jgi:hypothetical protein
VSVEFTTVTITPALGGTPLTLPMPEAVDTDAVGNVTFTFKDPTQDHRSALATLAARAVEQHRNRAGALLAVADAGAVLVTAAWSDVLPWDGTLRAQAVTGVLALPNYRVARTDEAFTVILYRAAALYERGTGTLTEAP